METFFYKLPKVELHCHLAGTVKPAAFVDLARKHGIDLPRYKDPNELYNYTTFSQFLELYTKICHSIRDRDDFRRVTYETLQEASRTGVRYREIFWNPLEHFNIGVPIEISMEGIIDGIHDAEKDFGIKCKIIVAINRQDTPEHGVELVQYFIDNRREEVIGIGMDYNEVGNPPEKFWKAYRLAENAGLRRTAHAGEAGSNPRNIETCLDLLKCDRIDHGYTILENDRILSRCRDEGIIFTVCPTAYRWELYDEDGGINWHNHPIPKMAASGLRLMLNTDDPGLHRTDPADAYIRASKYFYFQPEYFKDLILNGIDAAWIDDNTKAQWRKKWSQEIDALLSQL